MPILTITNGSFEATSHSDGDFSTGISGWNTSGDTGDWNPEAADIDESTLDGSNMAYLYDNGDSISQTLSDTYSSGQNYTFDLLIGDTYEASSNYTVNIYAGGTIIGTVTGDTGDFDQLSAISVSSNGYSNPALNGQAITIEIIKNSGGELGVDNVTGYSEDIVDIVEGTAGADTMGIGYTDLDGDQIDGADGNDESVIGYAGNDTINAGAGNDTVDGGDDADTFLVTDGFGNDTIIGGEGGTDDDTLDLSGLSSGVTVNYTGDEAGTATDGSGNITFSQIENITLTSQNDVLDATGDTDGINIDGGLGEDSLEGGSGGDTIEGGDGNDTISGGDDTTAVPLERVALQWSGIPDPDNGGQIDHADSITSGSQSVSGVNVTYGATGGIGTFDTNTGYVAGIDAGSSSVDVNSSLSLGSGTSTLNVQFSEGVENISFRINDFENGLETVQVTIYDPDGNPIPFTATQGSSVSGVNTDAVAGNDQFVGTAGGSTDDDAFASLGIDVVGPVGEIVIDFSAPAASVSITDIWFDDPATGAPATDGGDDSLSGGAGDDVIIGGHGTDSIAGGADTDKYDANTSPDMVDETITVVVDGNGDGTIDKLLDGTTDTFTSLESFIAGEDDNENDEITLTASVENTDVSGLDNTAVGFFISDDTGLSYFFGGVGEPTINDILTKTFDPGTGVLRPQGSYNITGGEENGGQVGTFYFENFEKVNFDVVCFSRGTMIETQAGETLIEDLKAGDLVRTLDHGFQPIRWIKSTTVAAIGKNAPVLIRKGALGNTRDLRVSPQHRMMLEDWCQELLFGELQTLATAKSLCNDLTIRQVQGGLVEYFHMMFDQHEIVFSEGSPSESFHPGAVGMGSFSDETCDEIFSLFPQLRDNLMHYGPSARVSLKAYEVACSVLHS